MSETPPSPPPGPAPSPPPCPPFDALLAHVGGYLPPDEAKAIDVHLGTCDACGLIVAEAGRALVSGGDAPPEGDDPSAATGDDAARAAAEPAPISIGDHLGRYLLMEELGRGAMGIVFAAYDPELDRKVALKIVRARRRVPGDELEARVLAEAQAMARVAHPNVVAVYDLGTLPGGGVYLAMELVPGETLRAWLAARPRTVREIVAAFAQAGDGLAAAHAAGIVHRDFKPDNALVDRQGRVRVTDFGLARMGLRKGPALDLGLAELTTSELRRTRAGTIIGTPAYMAPEQLDLAPVDHRADVFALGASLYEALFGTRPYAGKTFGELELALRRGVPLEPPARAAPRWVRRVVMRALQGDPAARYPTMAEMTAALRADPRKKLVRIGGTLAAAAVVATTIGVVRHLTTAEARGCRAGAEVELWTPDARHAAEAAFGATGKVFAGEAFATASAALARYADDWRAARIEACDATHERGEQSEALLDLRLRCLEQRREEATALGDAFAHADAATVEHAVEAVARLPLPAICAEAERLQARVPPPVDARAAEQARQAEAILASASAEAATGAWQAAQKHAEEARALARAADFAPTEAEALTVLALTSLSLGDNTAALAHYREAMTLAMRAGDDRLGASATAEYARFLSIVTREKDGPLSWSELAAAQASRIGEDERLALDVLTSRATILITNYDGPAALAALEAAMARYSGAVERVGALRVLDLATKLAGVYQQMERYHDAIATFEKARTLARQALGAMHPRTVAVESLLGACLQSAGHYARAEALLRDTLATSRLIYPADNGDVALVLQTLANSLTGLGRFDEALALHAQAHALHARLSADNPGTAVLDDVFLVQTLLRAGRGDEALAAITKVRQAIAEHFADNRVLQLVTTLLHALALETAGQLEEATRSFTALEPTLRAQLPDGTELAWTLDGLGRARLRAGQAAAAVGYHAEALAILERHYEATSLELGPTLIDLSRARCALAPSDEAKHTAERAETLYREESSDPLGLAEALLVRAHCGAPDSGREDQALERLRASPYPRARHILATPGE